ncbi:hypothetical protein AERO8C_150200 [Aeromonas veronii]|uniref:Uncharacterized protein n=1 Tax=Aeromonas veronii TaxID=654 RepID=A0A653KXA8_AERVE|nr:hypothetical protein AERO8C_150200 [Aeromonas veronii]
MRSVNNKTNGEKGHEKNRTGSGDRLRTDQRRRTRCRQSRRQDIQYRRQHAGLYRIRALR